jgi:DNA-binding MarR family transcriptional regulator
MLEDVPPSRMEWRFGDWMEQRGVDSNAFWACFNLVSAGDLLVILYGEALHPHGLTRDEWRILVMLDMVGESEPRRLAETLWLGRSTVVNAITRLEKQELVTRQQATNDRRLVVVRLTEPGRARVEDATKDYISAVNGLEWNFTEEEQEQLFRLSRRFWMDNFHRARKTHSSSPRVGEARVSDATHNTD